VLGATLTASHVTTPLLEACLVWWAGGLALYVVLGAGPALRLIHAKVEPAHFTPDYWLVMGALAISTLAATRLARAIAVDPLLHALARIVADAAVLTWTLATLWIPLLVALQVWRLLGSRPRGYEPGWWTGVFPLGMYAVCTHDLGAALRVAPLEPLSNVVFWIALLAWLATVIGAAVSCAPLARRRS
jgi:tellurite resistance protein TehA-like permease